MKSKIMRNEFLSKWVLFSVVIILFQSLGWLVSIGYQTGFDDSSTFSIFSVKGDVNHSDDIAMYGVQIRDAWENGWSLFARDPYLLEKPKAQIPNGQIPILLASFLFGLTKNMNIVPWLMIVVSAFSAVFLLLKMQEEWEEMNISISSTSFFVWISVVLLTSYQTWFGDGFWFHYMDMNSGFSWGLGYVTRFLNTHFTFPFLLLWFWLFMRWWRNPTMKNVVWLSVSLGILVYVYLYYWTGALVVTGFGILIKFLEIRNNRRYLRSVLFGLLIYATLCLPFLYAQWEFFQSPFSEIYQNRVGLHSNNGLDISFGAFLIWLPFLGLQLAHYVWGKSKKETSFRWILLGLPFLLHVLLNAHLIVGKQLQSGHWVTTFYYQTLVLFLPMMVFWIKSLFSEFGIRNQIINWIPKFVLSILLCVVIINQVEYGRQWAPYFAFSQEENELIDFLDSQDSKNVIGSDNVSILAAIKTQTPHKTFYPNAFLSLNTDVELLTRWMWCFRLAGLQTDFARSELAQNENYNEQYLRPLKKETPQKVAQSPGNVISLMFLLHRSVLDYEDKSYVKSDDIDNLIDEIAENLNRVKPHFRLDFLVTDKQFDQFRSDNLSGKVVFENSRFRVFSF